MNKKIIKFKDVVVLNNIKVNSLIILNISRIITEETNKTIASIVLFDSSEIPENTPVNYFDITGYKDNRYTVNTDSNNFEDITKQIAEQLGIAIIN